MEAWRRQWSGCVVMQKFAGWRFCTGFRDTLVPSPAHRERYSLPSAYGSHTASGRRRPRQGMSAMLGHATIGLTLDLYSHVLPDMQSAAALAMERVLGTGL